MDSALIDYYRGHTITQGEGAGQPVKLLPWEEEFLAYGMLPENDTAALTIARGNGKTTFISGIGTAVLDGPLTQPRGEAIIVASSFEQARVSFEHALGFMEEKYEDFHESGMWRIQDSANRASITNRETKARLRCIGSDPSRAHGLAGNLFILDEPAQWPINTRDRMYAAIRTARGKIPGSRLIALGTQSDDSEHWFQKLLKRAKYVQVHAAPKDCDPFDWDMVRLANPSLAYMPELEHIIKEEMEDARKDPALLASFRALRLNQGVADIERLNLLDAGIWERAEGDVPPEGDMVWGIDLGDGVAQSAVTAYWESGRLESLAAFPSEPDLKKRSVKDGVGDGEDSLYVKMQQRGELLITDGHVVKVHVLLNEALKRWGQPTVIVADRWRERDLKQGLKDSRVDVCPIVFRGQGYKDGAEDVRGFKRAMLDGNVTPTRSLLLRYGMREAVTVSDPAGNQKLAKATEGGRRKLARDDSVASAILAVALVQRRREEAAETEEDVISSSVYVGKARGTSNQR